VPSRLCGSKEVKNFQKLSKTVKNTRKTTLIGVKISKNHVSQRFIRKNKANPVDSAPKGQAQEKLIP
jgi:hypothetical protein